MNKNINDGTWSWFCQIGIVRQLAETCTVKANRGERELSRRDWVRNRH